MRDLRQRWRTTSFRSQIMLTTMVLTALGMVLVTLGLQVLVHRIVEGNLTQVLEDRSDSIVAAVSAASGRTLVVPHGVLDPGIVVFDADGNLQAGSYSPRVQDEVTELSQVRHHTIVNVGEDERLLARPFKTRSGVHGVVVVAEPLTPYEQTERYVALASILVGVLVVGAVGAIARWVTSRALSPVSQMAERATDWSEHDLGHRFGLGPPVNELSALGATLDRLLERVAMTIRSEQRLTSELAHELRTPLAAIQGSADLALLRGGLDDEARTDVEQIAASSRAMAETITTLLDLARDPSGGESTATSLLDDVLAAVTSLVPAELTLLDRVGRVERRELRIAAPADLVVRALSPVLENAVRHARSAVSLAAVASASTVEILVGDDGAGVDDSIRANLFAPGSSGPTGGTGLGLGIARRVARSIGGDVLVDDGSRPHPGGGALFVVRVPRI